LTAPAIITDDRTGNRSAAVPNAPRGFVRLRESPEIADSNDTQRILLLKQGWGNLDDLVRTQNRQIEENVRMIAGQQHSYYHPVFGKWMDVTDWMSDDERRWRQRPVLNRMLPWFVITHARATESQPIVTYVPGPDRADSELAEVYDIAMKTLFFEMGMEDNHDRMMAWVIAAGRGHMISRLDPSKGKMRPWIGEDWVPMVDEYDQPIDDGDGGQAMQRMPNVPFGPDGKARAKVIRRWDGSIDMQQTGEPHATPVGSVVADVLSPMQVRASWGPEPWHLKRRHYIKGFYTPEEVWDLFRVDCAPTVRGAATDVGELERILYGTGFYGSASNTGPGAQLAASSTEGYVEVSQMWEAPTSYGGMDKNGDSAGGRWLVTTPDKVLRDGVRPAAFPHTSPMNTWEFIRMPGRSGGTTPVEALTPIQRAYNANYGQIREHVNLNTNPKAVIDQSSGLKPGKFTNKPGENYVLNRRPGVPAIEYVQTPSLGQDVYKLQMMLREEFDDIGFARANEQNATESGEKLKEMRFDNDRFLGPTMRRAAGEYGRFYANIGAWLPLVWDMETVISYAGDDNIARTITVYPEMFKNGYVNIRPDVESMLPEGRGERQQQVYKMYLDGVFGLIGSPAALRKFWEMARMPHLSRAAKPGGIHTTTAEQENGKLLLGTPAQTIPVYEWYDDEAHLAIHEQFMASPEFLKLAQPIRDAFTLHRSAHQFNMQQKQAQAAMMQQALNPQPAPVPGGAGGAPTRGKPQPKDIGAGSARPAPPSLPSGTPPIAAPAPAPLPS
jgi:hypothetical protein